MTNSTGDFIGAGWAFPLRINAMGGLSLVTGEAELDASIRMIIETAPGERVMRPEFGCRIWDHVFDSTDSNTLGLMAQAVRDAISQWEPRVTLENVAILVDPDEPGRVHIEVAYQVRTTNDRRNLVHPFYVIPREDS